MSKPGYLSINITPARRINLDDARFVMRSPKATDIEVIDFAVGWFLVTAERMKVDKTKERQVRRALKQQKESDETLNRDAPTMVRAKELGPATRNHKSAP